MRTRLIVLLLALGYWLIACNDTPPPTQSSLWDTANFETANWN